METASGRNLRHERLITSCVRNDYVLRLRAYINNLILLPLANPVRHNFNCMAYLLLPFCQVFSFPTPLLGFWEVGASGEALGKHKEENGRAQGRDVLG